MSKSSSKTGIIISIICLLLAVAVAATTLLVVRPFYYENYYFATIPSNLSTGWSNEPEPIFSDFYVSADAPDGGNGTLERPFSSIDQAMKAVRRLGKDQLSHAVVAIMAGTYKINSLEFTSKDSGTEICPVIFSSYGDGEVIFDGGVEPGTSFTADNTTIIDIKDAKNIAFSGITFRNSSGCAIKAKGSNIDITNCKIENTGGNGIEINGTMISVNNCHISNTGASAIKIEGGNRKSLTPGNCSADNNLISATSRFDKTAPSVIIGGTGNALTNNEIINSPATAVYYSGNTNKIEYNYIHNTCYEIIGAAAVDSPSRWDCYGNFIRYNLFSTVGNGTDPVTAVKACSGTQVRGNMFINIKGVAMDFNGGRNIEFTNNIVHNCSTPILYQNCTAGADDPAWKQLKDSPYQSKAWKEAYPDCASLKTDYNAMTDPQFAANPSNSMIKDNIILHARKYKGEISPEANNYSSIEKNMIINFDNTDIFIDAEGGNYRIAEGSEVETELPDYRDIPFDSIGRY